jgi:hypothetical protein
MKAPIAGSDQGLASRHLVPSRTQRRGRWGRKRGGYSYATMGTRGRPADRKKPGGPMIPTPGAYRLAYHVAEISAYSFVPGHTQFFVLECQH